VPTDKVRKLNLASLSHIANLPSQPERNFSMNHLQRLPLFLEFLVILLTLGCGDNDKAKCAEVELVPETQARTKVFADVCSGDDQLSDCFFSLDKIIRTDNGEDVSRYFDISIDSGKGDCTCKAQVSLELLGEPETDNYKAFLSVEYGYVSVTDWGDHVEREDRTGSAKASICITVPGGVTSDKNPTGTGGASGDDKPAAAGSDA
jgi:hypothetical protein